MKRQRNGTRQRKETEIEQRNRNNTRNKQHKETQQRKKQKQHKQANNPKKHTTQTKQREETETTQKTTLVSCHAVSSQFQLPNMRQLVVAHVFFHGDRLQISVARQPHINRPLQKPKVAQKGASAQVSERV